MKLLIEGKEYDIERGISKASLYALFELKSRYGIGVKSMAVAAKRIEATEDTMDILEDEESFKVLMAMIWLARRYAGEKCTMEEANAMPIDSLQVITEEGDETPAPKAPTVSVPAAPSMPPRTTSMT